MTAVFTSAAETDLVEAARWYDAQRPGLGDDFVAAARMAVGRIVEMPEAWPPYEVGTRRCLTNRFPFGIVYRIHEDALLIVAVAHLHRRPGFWRDRD